MLRKILISSIIAASAIAGQYATLKDGRTIIMHENGTWEEATVARSGNEQLGVMAAKDIAGAGKVIEVQSEPLARMIVGKWSNENGSLTYDFRNDGTVTYTLNGETKTDSYSIQFIDSKDNTLGISLGEASRYGKIVFGGLLRKFKISNDGMSAVDYSDEITKLITVKIKKIGGESAATSEKPVSSSSTPINDVQTPVSPAKTFAK